MAVIVDQKRVGGGSHSTVGTVTDIASVLRLLFSRIGKPYVGSANAFSFNDPQGMCPECNGLGRKIGITPEALIDTTRFLMKGLSSPQGFLTGKAICMGVLASSTTTRRLPSIHPKNLNCFPTANRRRLPVLPNT